jgi:Putative peptidoglycan binding domain
MIYSGQRFAPVRTYTGPAAFRQQPNHWNTSALTGRRQFTTANINRGDRLTAITNGRNHQITNSRRDGVGAGQFRNGTNNLRGDWRNHVFAQRSANWHRDWDRGRDHWWHGHRCHFINGSWFIFDFGFYPWWPYWYPYDYYAYPYPYSYDPYYYDSGTYQDEGYYGQNGYADEYADSTAAAVQERLARQGYYDGEIDGVLGPQTRRAIARYQRDHRLRVTGYPTTDTLQALGLSRVASN